MGGFSSYQTALIDVIPESLMDPLALIEFEINDMTVMFIDLSEIINAHQTLEEGSVIGNVVINI